VLHSAFSLLCARSNAAKEAAEQPRPFNAARRAA